MPASAAPSVELAGRVLSVGICPPSHDCKRRIEISAEHFSSKEEILIVVLDLDI